MKIVKLLSKNTETALVTIFLMLFSLGQLQRVTVTNEVAFYLHDLIIAGFLLLDIFTEQKISYVLKKILLSWQKIIRRYPLETAWFGWLVFGMVVGSLAGQVTFKALLYLTRIIAYLSFIWLVGQKKQLTYSFKQGLLVAGSLIGAWGLLQYWLLPDVRFLYLFGWDNHYYRLISTLFDPAFTGVALVLTIGLWQMPSIFSKIPQKWRLIAQILLAGTVAATFSRASYAALLVLLGLWWAAKKIHWRPSLLIIAVLLATILILPKPGGEGVNLARTSTAEARASNAHQGLERLQGAQWLWGRGMFNNDVSQDYQTPSHAQLPDSLPVLSLNATGVGGTILSLLVLKQWLVKWWKKDPIWTSMLVAVLIHSLFNNTLLQPFVFLMLWGSKAKN